MVAVDLDPPPPRTDAERALAQAIASGVFLYVEAGRLRYRVRAGELSAELRSELNRHKDEIVRHLERVRSAPGEERFAPPPVRRREPGGRVPLSYAQQRLWFIDRLGKSSVQYHAQGAYQLTGRLDVAAFRRALVTVVERHEALRTVVAEENGSPYQVVLQAFTLAVPAIDLRRIGAGRQESEIRRLAVQDAVRAFDLTRDLMLRVHLVILAADSHVALFNLHHIAADAWSLGILLGEFSVLYAAYRERRPNPLAPPALQYADYTAWQRSWLQGDVLERQLRYWAEALQGMPEVHDLPLDAARPPRQTWAGGEQQFRIEAPLLRRLESLCARLDVTLFVLLHTAAALLVSRFSGAADVVMGTPVAGRVRQELEPILGLFLNTLVLRTRLDGDPTFEELLASGKRGLLDALAHQHVPLEMVVEHLRPRRSPSYNPLFQILFNMQPAERQALSLPGIEVEAIPDGLEISKFELVFNVAAEPDALSIHLGFNSDVFAAPTIARMAASFRSLLESVVERPGRRAGDLDLLAPAERERLLRALDPPREAVPLAVVDPAGRLLPEGALGELCVAAAAAASDRPGSGAAAGGGLVAAALPGAPERVLVRTGDLVRWSATNGIERLGRVADRTRVAGVRVDLARFRAALEAAEWLARFVVTVRRDAEQREVLVAYVVPAADRLPPPPAPERLLVELRRQLAAALADHPVLFGLVACERIPLSSGGETDFASLPPPRETFAPEEVFLPPASETERRMESVWRRVLPGRPIGVNDNFFAAGGHSLAMVVLIKRISRELGVDVSLASFIAAPTIRAVAALVDDQVRERNVAAPLVALSEAARRRPLPLSYAQQRLWFITRLETGRSSYNIPGRLLLRGRLCREALRATFETIAARHAILRTVYREENGQPVQVILDGAAFALPLVDLSRLPPAARARCLDEQARDEAVRPFDLARELGLRCRLLRLGEDEHVLSVSMHHIASDGWSVGILIRELNAIYGALRRGRRHPLPALAVQYCDFAVWQREHLARERLDVHLGFWRERLQGAPRLHNLPLDRPRGRYQSDRGAHHAVNLGADLAERLRELGRSSSGTLFMVLQTALALLVHRFSGEPDVLIGVPVANRLQREVEPLIGCFVNTLVLRSVLAGDPRFCDFLAGANERSLQALAHQVVPFEMLVDELKPERSLGHAPLFQIMLAFQDNPGGDVDLPGLHAAPMAGAYPISKFDLTLHAGESPAGLSLTWEYATALWDQATIESLAAAFNALLASIAESPEAPVGELRLLSGDDERRLLSWSVARAGRGIDGCIHELFEQQAGERPDAIAVACGELRLSYAAVNARADRLARRLARQGVRPGTLVGVCIDRSPELVVGLLAVLKAGGAYLPLDAAYPEERWRYMLADSGADVVLAGAAAGERLRAAARRVVVLDVDDPSCPSWEGAPGPPGEPAAAGRRLGPESLAYVIYTSGSTGRPKGVAVAHRGVVRLVCEVEYVHLDAATVTLAHSPISFDAATFEIWAPLLNGGMVALLQGDSADVETMAAEIELQGVDTLWLSAGVLPLWTERRRGRATRLRWLLAGGDVVAPDRVAAIHRDDHGVTVVNGYGPTENTTFSCCHRVPRQAEAPSVLPIGRPIAGTSAYVLDEQLRLLPAGCPGELCVGGAGLAWGYLHRPELTALAFVPHPFALTPGERLYRTGDVARWLPGGGLEFLGRRDRQVKVRGFRVEPGEVEAQLAGTPGVRESVVAAVSDADGGKRLVAYLVPEPGGDPGAAWEALRERCRRELRRVLPEHMVPSAWVMLDRMPLTAHGKIDRRALREPGEADVERQAFVAARTATERRLAAIWQEVLARDRIGIDDNFFALGGHSLRATRIISAVREVFDTEMPLRLVFEKPTVRELATWLDTYDAAAAPGAAAAEGGEQFV